ncbi:MAG: hypothetical protein MK207_03870 [Saprospiraceae bacterium]|nr:hypothetical protein [Saprospiraceae bacterium]
MKPKYIVGLILVLCVFLYYKTCGGETNKNDNANSTNIDSTTIEITEAENTEDTLSQAEQLQNEMNAMIEEQLQLSKESKSKNVKAMLANFELGMSKRQVKKHVQKMKNKKHLVRIKKSDNVFEYIYKLKLASGRSNTYMDFEYSPKGGVYKSICKPSKFRKMSKSDFLMEVKDLLTEWYGTHNFEVPDTKGCSRYIWITGNQHLDLYCTTRKVEFVFTDLNFEIPPNIEGGGESRPKLEHNI